MCAQSNFNLGPLGCSTTLIFPLWSNPLAIKSWSTGRKLLFLYQYKLQWKFIHNPKGKASLIGQSKSKDQPVGKKVPFTRKPCPWETSLRRGFSIMMTQSKSIGIKPGSKYIHLREFSCTSNRMREKKSLVSNRRHVSDKCNSPRKLCIFSCRKTLS